MKSADSAFFTTTRKGAIFSEDLPSKIKILLLLSPYNYYINANIEHCEGVIEGVKPLEHCEGGIEGVKPFEDCEECTQNRKKSMSRVSNFLTDQLFSTIFIFLSIAVMI